MMTKMMQDLNRDRRSGSVEIKIAIDTGKALIKSTFKGPDGQMVMNKFPATIGIADGNNTFNKVKPFKCSLLGRDYYMNAPGLCNITTTNDNQKNGTGRSTGAGNHDREIVTLGACLSIVLAMKAWGVYSAVIDAALGMPVTEYIGAQNHDAYFKSILPIGIPIRCTYEGIRYDFRINKSGVFPETLAAFYANKGNDMGNIIVVDIGGNNIQFVCSNNGNIDFNPTKTFTDKGGVNSFVRRLSLLMKQNQIEPVGSFTEIMGWLMNPKSIPATFGDDWKNRFTDLVKAEKAAYFAAINEYFNPINGNYAEEMRRGYMVCYTGGGSILLKNEIRADKKASLFDGGEFANVTGFYKLFR